MKNLWHGAGLLALILAIIACDKDDTEPKPEPEPRTPTEFTIPARAIAHHVLPVAMEVAYDIRPERADEVTISATPPNVQGNNLILKRGRGAVLLTTSASGAATVQTEGSSLQSAEAVINIIESPATRNLSGDLSGQDLVWDSTSVILIESNVRVPAGSTLNIQSGAIILLGSLAEILVEGTLECGGVGNPVQFLPADPAQPWGEIEHLPGSSAEYRNVFFVGGGGNPARVFGHSFSQPVLGGTECMLTIDHAVIMDCPGKAFGLLRSEATISHSLITRCDTGGEFLESLIDVSYSHILDMPDDDFQANDDDNDGFYFFAPWSGGDQFSRVSHCVFMTGEDDAIDHNGANLRIEDCVIQEFYHEGVAASSGQTAQISNTLVMDCDQGIEAGYGDPEVLVSHCTLIHNRIGLRFGDSYTWGDSGSIAMINSVIFESDSLNVWNYDLSLEGPRENAIGISYSIVNQPEYDQGTGCLTGTPVVDRGFELTPESVGSGAASDSMNMGLLPLSAE
jgi:hypothetical protein